MQATYAAADIRVLHLDDLSTDEHDLLRYVLRAYRQIRRGRIEVWKRPQQAAEVSIIHTDTLTEARHV